MAFKIPYLDAQWFTKGYLRDIPNFSWTNVTEKTKIGKVGFVKTVRKTVNKNDRPNTTEFVAFVRLPFIFWSLDLFVASLLFKKGTLLLQDMRTSVLPNKYTVNQIKLKWHVSL